MTNQTDSRAYGYARVSTDDQDVTLQREALLAAGADHVREEIGSGTTMQNRPELRSLLDFMRSGDTLIVTRVDRLARSIRDLQNIVHDLREKGVTLRCTEQPIDTSTAAGKCFLDMLGVFAEFETNIRRERQMEGIAKAKAAGVYKGRKPKIDAEKVKTMRAEGVQPAQIARELGVARSSVYRALAG